MHVVVFVAREFFVSCLPHYADQALTLGAEEARSAVLADFLWVLTRGFSLENTAVLFLRIPLT